MASGHVNRTYRPNTWQHRPSLRREDSSCQPGAVQHGTSRTWRGDPLTSAVGGRADDIPFKWADFRV